MKDEIQSDFGFRYRALKSGELTISRDGKQITRLSGHKALRFLEDIENLSFSDQQQIMARLTGNYKRGNERQAKRHYRNS